MEALENVALLVCLPVEHQRFLEQLPASDYLKKYSLEPERAWATTYLPQVAEPLQRLISRARKLGAKVGSHVTLQALRDATASCRVVILVSHWKGCKLTIDDLLSEDKAEYLTCLKGTTGSASRYLEQHLLRDSIVGAISRFIDSDDPILNDPDPNGFTVVSDALTVCTERRDTVDALMSGLVKPGNLLELSDGLYTRHVLSEQIDQRFTGVLDVAACNSSVLADYLDRVARGRFRIVQFPDVLDPELSCEALHLTFDLINEHGIAYPIARTRALKFVASKLRELVRAVRPGPLKRLWRSLWHT